jgi:peptide-methionine (R)-S-oxide reductase
MAENKQNSEENWKKKLSPDQYKILRQCGTEPPFSGKLLKNKGDGMYVCAACGNPLFSSETKYNSGSGWPSFWQALDKKNIKLEDDTSLGIKRIEVKCAKCGSHLGHVFNDGPKPTGKRYCINSTSLNFKSAKGKKDAKKI